MNIITFFTWVGYLVLRFCPFLLFIPSIGWDFKLLLIWEAVLSIFTYYYFDVNISVWSETTDEVAYYKALQTTSVLWCNQVPALIFTSYNIYIDNAPFSILPGLLIILIFSITGTYSNLKLMDEARHNYLNYIHGPYEVVPLVNPGSRNSTYRNKTFYSIFAEDHLINKIEKKLCKHKYLILVERSDSSFPKKYKFKQ